MLVFVVYLGRVIMYWDNYVMYIVTMRLVFVLFTTMLQTVHTGFTFNKKNWQVFQINKTANLKDVLP